MTIENSNWTATLDKMPSTEGPKLHVSGTVTVANPGVRASLVRRDKPMFKDLVVRLDLCLENTDAIVLQVETEQAVRFSTDGTTDWTFVEIYHNDALLVRMGVDRVC
ncbi:hypothetical protein SJI00_10060 [Pseudomonas sp. RP23018S]|uniref:hypothetical protein n=1 Tax=Pseudomonas sp. RP23018S TaxID=3096037 RepID=UPI002ACABC8E|nr:hypothetical protein [Pseudomonas sp. RP23018S]MDZ5603117.1 hypothetical protein [Pseudomonas sp. RP23018S]